LAVWYELISAAVLMGMSDRLANISTTMMARPSTVVAAHGHTITEEWGRKSTCWNHDMKMKQNETNQNEKKEKRVLQLQIDVGARCWLVSIPVMSP
jgi:hypothetical protein